MKNINYFFVGVMMLVALVSLLIWNEQDEVNIDLGGPFACTKDAKMCPDGSFVGRTGPNCEFVCPEVEVVQATTHPDIQIDAPLTQTIISSPLALSGQAKGPWYFEASAPVVVEDTNGNMLGQGFVTAQGDWMTTDFVLFAGTVTFTVPVGVTNGFVVFKKDNPSGEPQFDAQVAIPVQFAP